MRRGGDAEHSGAQRSGRHGTQHRRLHPCHRGGHEAGLCGPKRGSGRSRLRPGGRGAADQQGPRGGAVCPLLTGDGGGIRSGGGDRGQGVPRKHLSLCSDGPLWERGLPDPDCTGLVRLRDRGGRLRLCAQQRHVRLQRQAGRTHQPGTDLWERQQHPGGEDASVLHGPQHGVQGRTALSGHRRGGRSPDHHRNPPGDRQCGGLWDAAGAAGPPALPQLPDPGAGAGAGVRDLRGHHPASGTEGAPAGAGPGGPGHEHHAQQRHVCGRGVPRCRHPAGGRLRRSPSL